MDQIHHIRALYYEQGYNISEIAKATNRDWKTVAKYIDITDFNEPQPVPASERKFCPKLDPYSTLYSNLATHINIFSCAALRKGWSAPTSDYLCSQNSGKKSIGNCLAEDLTELVIFFGS